MLALIYLFIAVLFGDILSRRFLSYRSIPHRLAVAFLTGILLSTCFTYPAALLFAGSSQPLLWANFLFLGFVALAVFIIRKLPPRDDESPARPPGKWQYDVIVLAACMILGCWLMFTTLDFKDGSFAFAVKSWSDFGPNLSLAQSLAVGNNYPTVHPFYPTEIVRYHFLFWFLSASLSYLGLNLVWAINILSILSLLSLLILIMTFAEVLFNSRVVGRISVALFFFASSSLSYIPFLLSQDSISGVVSEILRQRDFLKSGFPYRGDDWGALSVTVFANQRQLLSAVGIVLIVLIYLVQFYRKKGAIEDVGEDQDFYYGEETGTFYTGQNGRQLNDLSPMIYCGLLIGALPYWNTAVFLAASIILGSLFLLFSKRHYLLFLIATVVFVGLPQILLLRSGNVASPGHSFFNWGYIVAAPTFAKMVEYLLWTFGFKWLLLFLGLFLVSAGYRKLLLAFSAPFFVVFLFQLSTDVFNNHKLLNIWNVLVSFYIAYVLWEVGRKNIFRSLLAVVLAVAMVLGAVIDLAPVRNDGAMTVPYQNDRLTAWLTENTAPGDIFLTDRFLSHPILFSGRKIFLGNTLFAWSAGYDLGKREKTHVKMLTTHDISQLRKLLAENNIAYVAIDDGLRSNNAFLGLNEELIRKTFPLVFNDREQVYGNLKIYRVTRREIRNAIN
jgi:hypothetical protein